MRSETSGTIHPKSGIRFLSASKLELGTIRFQIDARIWPFQLFMKGSFTALLNARLCLKRTASTNKLIAKESMIRTYSEAVNYLF